MEQQIKREVATQTAAAGKAAAPRKRDVAAAPKKAGLTTQDLISSPCYGAAGAVPADGGSLPVDGHEAELHHRHVLPGSSYLTRPKLGQALIIGLLAGLICQIPLLNATPLLNILPRSRRAARGLLIKVPMSIGGKLSEFQPASVNTFVSTVVSGGTFALLSVYINVVSTGGDVMVALATYAAIVLGTATFNCILVQVLAMPLKKVLKVGAGSAACAARGTCRRCGRKVRHPISRRGRDSRVPKCASPSPSPRSRAPRQPSLTY